MTSTLVFQVAADSWNGDPLFTVSVDGTLLAGTFTATASHAAGQWQDIVVTGDFSATPGSVSVAFINDAYGGWNQDRNLYVRSLTLGGTTLSAADALNTGGAIVDGVANVLSNGTVTFDTAGISAAPAVATATATPPAGSAAANSLTLRVAADSWNGDPQFTVTVDGKQVSGIFTATASRAQGQWQDVTVTGPFSATPGNVSVAFINDGYGGWNQDRNLYVQSLTIGGTTYAASAATNSGGTITNGVANVFSNGIVSFDTATAVVAAVPATPTAAAPAPVATPVSTTPVVTAPVTTPTSPAPTPAPATNTLTLRVAADSWNGDPQFTVTVDGQPIGGIYSASASHAAGQWQNVTVTGAFGATPSTVNVTFINDTWAGWNEDRNLYVQSLTLNGVTLSAAAATNTGGAIVNGVATVLSNGTVTFDTSAVPAAPGASAPAAPVTTTTAAPVTTPTPVATPAVVTTPVAAPVVTAPVMTPAPTATTASTTNTLTVRVAADSWNGDPQFTVTVDGKQIGGTYSTAASHATGQWQDVTVSGAFSATPASVSVAFINDGYGGWNEDRNLYVQSLSINGQTFAAANATNSGGTITSGVANVFSNGIVTFNTAAAASSTVSAIPASATPTTASTATSGLQLLGVNLAGAEFGFQNQPGTYGTDYTYPTHQEIDYYASKGLNVIRLPFLWERLQTSENGPLDASELARITDIVNYAGAKNMKVILDPHDYGSGFGQPIGSAGTPNSSFQDFWSKLAGTFAKTSNVIFGLMNEPHVQSATDWLTSANDAIQGIRGAGANQEILVPGAYWDTAATWTTSDNASVVGTGVKDPDNNYAFEVHQYLDANNAGTQAGVSSDTVGVDRLSAITAWAENNGAKLFLGEFGVSQDQQSLSALDKMLSFMQGHSDVWQGGTYWAGGPWWWGSNIYGIEPNGLGTSNVTDQPQMAILTSHIATSHAQT